MTSDTEKGAAVPSHAELQSRHRITLEALFRHPAARNVEWMDVLSLFEIIGTVHRTNNDKFVFDLRGEHYIIHKPHTKDVTVSEVVDLRRLLERAGWSAQGLPPAASPGESEPITLMVVIDHHGAKIYRIEHGLGKTKPYALKPYDPYDFLHHLTHKDQSRAEGQRAPEDPDFYRRIAEALAAASRILVVGHGKGTSNAAQHLLEYLHRHYRETFQRVVRLIEADLSAVTTPQLLELAEQVFA